MNHRPRAGRVEPLMQAELEAHRHEQAASGGNRQAQHAFRHRARNLGGVVAGGQPRSAPRLRRGDLVAVSVRRYVAVLPRWLKVQQAVDFVAGVHPRFRRERCEEFLNRTNIKRTSRVKELSKGMITQLHLALVMEKMGAHSLAELVQHVVSLEPGAVSR